MLLILRGLLCDGSFLALVATLVVSAPHPARSQPAIVPSCVQKAQLIGIGKLGAGNRTCLEAVSADGTAAVGWGPTLGNSNRRGLVFTLNGSGGTLTRLPGSGDTVTAHGVSRDGSVVVGIKSVGSDNFALRWVNGGLPEELGFLEPTIKFSRALAVSDDGNIVAGQSRALTAISSNVKPFRWTPGGGLEQLPALHPNGFGQVKGMSPNGRWIVGYSDVAPGTFPTDFAATVWDNGQLGTLQPPEGSLCMLNGMPYSHAEAWDVSADGRTILGNDFCPAVGMYRGLIWSPAGLGEIEPLPGDDSSRVRGISQDGKIVVGESVLSGVSSNAIIWTQEEGTRSLLDVLEHQVDVSGWTRLETARDVTEAPFGTVIVGFGVRPDTTTEGFVAILPCADDDFDGLCNRWEEMEGIDLDGDGEIGVGTDVLLPGADPDHMNLYVEVDFVGPSVGAEPFDLVERAFANVPAALIGNPDGTPGITLYTELGDEGLTLAGGGSTYSFAPGGGCALTTEFTTRKSEFFGDIVERGNSDLLAVKERIYRYAIFGGEQPSGVSGVAEINGNDFVVTLEGFDGLPNGTLEQQAGTFMHELGHTLGLGHAGPGAFIGVNYKPNYHSVMNYLWQLPGEGAGLAGLGNQAFTQSWVLDFSREKLPTLVEAALFETAGIGGNALFTVPIGPPPGRFVNEALPVDFDRDDTIEADAVGSVLSPIDVNQPTMSVSASPGSVLEGGRDWSFVALGLCSFYGSNLWEAGVHSCTIGQFGESQLDMTQAELDDLRTIEFIDCNLNGILDDTDLLGGATDTNANGLLDECEPLPGDLDGDEDVDLDDRTLFADSFGSGESEPEYLPAADFDADRTVTLPDYALWVDAFVGPLPVQPAAPVEIRIEPAVAMVDPGETFEMRIESTLPAGTLGFGLDLTFDESVLEVVGDPVIEPAWTPVFARDLDGLAGLAPTAGLEGAQRIATLTLRAVEVGTTDLVPTISVVDETEGVVVAGGAFAAPTAIGATVTVGSPTTSSTTATTSPTVATTSSTAVTTSSVVVSTSSTLTTTSTIIGPTSTSTTSTTMPVGPVAQRLSGKKLLLRDAPGKEKKRSIKLLSKDASISLGRGNGSADDPVLNNASLRVVTQNGDAFDTTYALASDRWKYRRKAGGNKGYRFKARPFKSIIVRPGMIKVVANGLGLEHSLGLDPRPVHVVITLGEQRYCMTFGGDIAFREGRKFLAKDAPMATACGLGG